MSNANHTIIATNTRNFEKNIKEINYSVDQLNDYLENVDDNLKGKCLRQSNDYLKGNLLKFDEEIRENEFISKYLYKGNDFAKNYLIDNGFFVPSDDMVDRIIKGYSFFQNRKYTYFAGQWITKDCLFDICNALKKEHLLYNDEVKEWNHLVDQNRTEVKPEGGVTTWHTTYSWDEYCNTFLKSHYNPVNANVVILLLVIFISLILGWSCMGGQNSKIANLIFFLLPAINTLLYLYLVDILDKSNFKADKKHIDAISNVVSDKISKYEVTPSAYDDEFNNINVNNYYPVLEYKEASFELYELNNLYYLMMNFGYPYTFANGETYKPLYVDSAWCFQTAIINCLQSINKYNNYLEKYVLPIIRKNCRDGHVNLYELNGLIVEELRVQMRHEEVLKSINNLINGLRTLEKQMQTISSQINDVNRNLEDLYYEINWHRN